MLLTDLDSDQLELIAEDLKLRDVLSYTRVGKQLRDAGRRRLDKIEVICRPLGLGPFYLGGEMRRWRSLPVIQRTLHLSISGIDATAMAAFSDAVAEGALDTTEDLFLTDNLIGDAGMEAFASACGRGALKSLERLWLHSNKIHDAGVIAFAKAVEIGALAQLTKLCLLNNKIGDPGCTALAEAVGRGALSALEELGLDHNQIGDAGVTALAEAMGSGALPSLKRLFIDSPSAQLKAHCSSKNIGLVQHGRQRRH